MTSIPNSIETRDAHHSPATDSMYSRPGIVNCTLNDPPGLSSVPPGVNCCANLVSGITTKTFLIQRLQRHQPPRV